MLYPNGGLPAPETENRDPIKHVFNCDEAKVRRGGAVSNYIIWDFSGGPEAGKSILYERQP